MASQSLRKGKIQTVQGLINPNTIHDCLMHEHVLIDCEKIFFHPTSELPKSKGGVLTKDELKKLENSTDFNDLSSLYWLQYNASSNHYNLVLDQDKVMITELEYYRKFAGHAGLLCELSTRGIHLSEGRAAHRLAALSRASDVHIVAGTGFYVDAAHPEYTQTESIQQIADRMIDDCLKGFLSSQTNECSIKAGIIGELGCSYPLTQQEIKVLKAAVICQSHTGLTISIHTGRDPNSPYQVAKVLCEAGARMDHVVLGHLDRTFTKRSEFIQLAKKIDDVILELDLFGIECSKYHFNEKVDMPSDGRRLDYIKALIDAGFENRIVVSHDIYSKHRLISYGGHGYAHLVRNIKPRMILKGIKQHQVEQIFEKTPKRLLTIFTD